MFERKISEDDVRHIVRSGQVIEEYVDDKPFPRRLVLGWQGSRPLHVVVADNNELKESIVITVYEPDGAHWKNDFTERKIR